MLGAPGREAVVDHPVERAGIAPVEVLLPDGLVTLPSYGYRVLFR